MSILDDLVANAPDPEKLSGLDKLVADAPAPQQTIGDYVRRLQRGATTAFQGVPAQAVAMLGGPRAGVERAQAAADSIGAEMTPAAAYVDQNPGQAPVQAVLGAVVESAPTVAQMLIGGAPLAGAMGRAKIAEHAASGLTKIGIPQKVAGVIGRAAETAPFFGIEGAQAGLMGAMDVERQARETPIEGLRETEPFKAALAETDASLPMAAREEQAREALAQRAGVQVLRDAGLSTGLIGAATGAGGAGVLARRLFGRATADEASKGLLRTIASAAGREAFQEAPQSAGERFFQNKAIRDFIDPNQELSEGVLQDALLGAAAGGVLGAGMGGLGYLARPRGGRGSEPPEAEARAEAPPPTPPVDPTGPIGAAVAAGQQSGAIPTNVAGGPVDAPGPGEAGQGPGPMGKSSLEEIPVSDEKTSALSAIADIAAKVPADAPLAPDSPVGQAMAGAIERATAAGATQEDLLAAAAGRVPPPDIRPSPKEVKAATKELDAAIDRVGKLTEKIARANAAADKARERGDEETAGNAESLAATLRDRLETARGQLETLQGAQRAGTGSGPVPGTDVGTGVLPADGRPRGGSDQPGRADAGGSVAVAGVPAGRPAGEGAGLAAPAVPPADGGGARPVVLQNRDRSSAASVAQMASIAGNPDPKRLSYSREFGTGAPVVFANADAAAIPETQLGAADEVVDASGRTVPVQYAVVEAAEVVASNRADGAPNDLYADAETPGLIRAVAGNGRMAGLQEAFNRGTAAGYVEGIAADARLHGVNPDVIRGMQNPVLVRVMRSADVTPDIGDRSNVSGISQLNPVEQARTDMARVNLDGLEFGEDGAPTVESVRRFVQAMPAPEQSSLMMAGGAPGKQAVDRLMAATFAKAYGATDLIELYAQATDPEARNVISALAQAAGPMARLEGAGDLDIRPAVMEAVRAAVNASRRGVSLAKFSQQRDFDVTPEAWRVVEHFVANARSAKRMAEGLRNLADAAYAESQKGDVDMFGAVPKRTGGQVINEVFDGQQREGDAGADANAGRAGLDEEGAGGRGGRQDERAPASDPGQPATEGRPADGQAGSFGLVAPTREDILRQQEIAEREAQGDTAPAAPAPDDFTLTGSNSPVDQARARGQMELGGEAPVDAAAAQAATSPKNDTPEPTEAQKDAGNYRKGHVRIAGLDIAIENEAGTKRNPDWPALAAHYGYVKRTEGADGDQVDVFIRPGTPEDFDGAVFVIDQMVDGRFDEHKVMLGYPNQPAAAKAYRDSYTKGWKGMGPIRRMTMDEFKTWLKDGDTTAPAAEKKAEGERPGESVQDRSNREWRENYDRVVNTADLTTLDTRSLEVAISFGARVMSSEGRKGWDGGPVNEALLRSVETDVEAMKAELRRRGVRGAPAAAEKIDDVGEKIGGARKDLATKTGPRTAKVTDEAPGWRKRYTVSQVAKSSTPGEEGRWVINDKRQKDWRGQPKEVGKDFATKEEAEAAIPLVEVARNHRATPVSVGHDKSVYEITRMVTDRKRVKVVDRQFPTRDEAMQYMVEHAVEIIETRTSFGEEILPAPDTVKRTGPVRRQGNATSDQFKETFGFRAVEFGNWNSQEERQEVMNHAFDGLADLAEVLGIPTRAIGLNGELALAFGARGSGLTGARAHYEPDYSVINLTKMRGAGSLAHEWLHALDHYLGRQDGKASSERVKNNRGDTVFKTHSPEGDMASHGFKYRDSGVRPEVREAYAALIETMYRKAEQFVEDTQAADRFVGKAREDVQKHLGRIRENLATKITYRTRKNAPASAEQLAAFDEIARKIVDGEAIETTVMPAGKSGVRWSNDALEALSRIIKDVRGHSGFLATRDGTLDRLRAEMEHYSQRLKMLAQAQSAEVKTKKVPTAFAMAAKSIDQGRASDYWSTPHEMAARAFQSYVLDKIAERGGASDFLTYGNENLVVPTPWGWQRPFPAGEERRAINAAFDKLVATLETRETDSGIAIYEPSARYSVHEPQRPTQQIELPLAEGGGASSGRPGLPGPDNRARRSAVQRVEATPEVRLETTPDPAGVYLARTELVAERHRTIHADRVTNPQEAAVALASVADYAVEHFHGLVTDKAGKPLALVGMFRGSFAETRVYAETIYAEAFRVKGAANIWFTHNHPSGKAEFSAADRTMFTVLRNALQGTGIKPRGFFAQTHSRGTNSPGAWVFTDNGHDTIHGQALPADIKASSQAAVPVVERVIVEQEPRAAITNSAVAKDAARAMQTTLGTDAPFVMLMSAQNEPIGAYPLKPGELAILRKGERAANLFRAVSTANARASILVDAQHALTDAELDNVAGALSVATGVRPLDALIGKNLASRMETGGWSPPHGSFFSRREKPVSGMNAKQVESVADRVRATWANGPEVVVLGSFSDAPAAVREAEARSKGATGRPEGFFHDGKVYLVADALATPADVARVLFHEALGHYGLRGLFGGELGRILDQIAAVRRAEVEAKRTAYGLPDTAAGRRVAAEEVLAGMAQTNPQLGFVRRAVAAIRAWLRGLGLNLRMTDDEIIRSFILPARAFVERGPDAMAQGESAFARSEATPIWYSPLARAIEGINAKSQPASAWSAQITSLKGIKPDEIEWSGVKEWLALQQGKVTKDAVLEYLAGNGVRVEEVMLGERRNPTWRDYSRALVATGLNHDEANRLAQAIERGDADAAEEAEGYGVDVSEVFGDDGSDATKFAGYRVPGAAENYRELLLTLPTERESMRAKLFAMQLRLSDLRAPRRMDSESEADYDARWKQAERLQAEIEPLRQAHMAAYDAGTATEFRSGHWDQPNVLAHVRMDERKSVEPLTEQQQADNRKRAELLARADAIAQKMARASRDARIAGDIRREELLAKLRPLVRAGKMTPVEMMRRLDDAAFADSGPEMAAMIREREQIMASLPPEHKARTKRVLFINELQSDWGQRGRKHGFKGADRLIDGHDYDWWSKEADRLMSAKPFDRDAAMRAAENRNALAGKPDEVARGPFVEKTDAWVALALKRAIRYAVDNGFDRVAIISGDQAADLFDLSKQVDQIEWDEAAVAKNATRVRIEMPQGAQTLYVDNADGKIIRGGGPLGDVAGKALDDVIGKEIAEKIAGSASGTLSGDGLKIGDHGMRGFYDKIVPTVLKDVLKKLGGPAPTTVTIGGAAVGNVYQGNRQVATNVSREKYDSDWGDGYRFVQMNDPSAGLEQLGFDITPELRDRAAGPLPMFSRRPSVQSVQRAVGQATQAIKGATLQDTWQRMVNAWKDKKPLALQLLGRRQIVDVYGNLLPHLTRYSNEMQQYDADKNESAAVADELVNRWRKLADADALADVMHDATLLEFDPDTDNADNPELQALQDRFNGLTDGAKGIYREARDAYRAHWEKVKAAIQGRIERAAMGENERRMMMEQFRDQFLQPIRGVYFPLARFGDYVITAKDGQDQRVVVFAETLSEAQAEHARMTREFSEVSKITLRKEYNAAQDAVSKDFVRKLFETVDSTAADGAEADLLKDAINQLYLTSLPDVSWAKHGIHRKGTPGYSKDARRAFAMNMFHGGYYLSKLKHADVLQDYLRAMQEFIDGRKDDAAYDSITAQQVVNEMVKRHDLVMNPDNSVVANTLTGMGFVWFLGLSPASAAVNLSQTALVAYPIMAARFGYGKAADALTRASKEAMQFRNDLRGRYGAEENAAIDRAVREGLVDITQAHDLAGIAEGRDNQLRGALSPVMRAASYLFHQAEKFNRQATFIAAYRLARQAGEGAEQAYDTARDLTYKGHFDYAASNRPRVMMGPVARVLLLFKQYGQNMIYTLGRNALLAAKGDREARRALSGILVAHGLTAGMMGLPLASVLMGLASIIGSSDDEPWDAEVAFRNYLADAVGTEIGEVIAKGVFRSVFPGDVASRVGLDSLLIRDIDLTLEPGMVWKQILESALGPVLGGVPLNVARGAADLAKGDFLLGVQGMLPKAIADGVKTIRYATEGVKDRTGIEVLDEVTANDMIAQVLGFSPARVREAYDARRAIYGKKRAIDDRRESLLRDFSKSVIGQDHETRLKTLQEIQAFNQANPTVAITPQSMLRSIQNRVRRQAQAKDGIYLPRKQRDLAELGRFANTR